MLLTYTMKPVHEERNSRLNYKLIYKPDGLRPSELGTADFGVPRVRSNTTTPNRRDIPRQRET